MFLGVDIGTSSAKAILLHADGHIFGEGAAQYAVHSPRPGWAESDPTDWWEAASTAVRQAAGGKSVAVEAIGLSGQMHGVVVSEADDTPLRPAILWADTRSSLQLAAYQALGADVQRRLANPYVTGMAGPSLLWLCEHESPTYTAARWALQPKDWLRLRLTGETFTDPSDASATLLYDLPDDDWAFANVDALGLRADLLPPIVPSSTLAGSLTERAADHLGLRAGIPVAAGAADTAAAALGMGLLLSGTIQLTVGSGGQIVAPLDAPVPDPTFRTHLYRAAAPRRWYAMAAIQNVGIALEWARSVLGTTWDQVYAEAFAVPPGAEGLTFLPYLTGERTPHLDPSVRGAWVGMGLHHGRAHLLRAALEGVAFALREGVETLEARGIQIPELRLAGGGTLQQPWRQLLADVLERPLHAVPDPGASARGAALLAGIAVGAYTDAIQTLEIAPNPHSSVWPSEASPLYREPYRRYLELYPRLREQESSNY